MKSSCLIVFTLLIHIYANNLHLTNISRYFNFTFDLCLYFLSMIVKPAAMNYNTLNKYN